MIPALPRTTANPPPPCYGHPEMHSRMSYYLIILVKLVILYFKKVNQNTGWHGVVLSYVTYFATNMRCPWAYSAHFARYLDVCNLLPSVPRECSQRKIQGALCKLLRTDRQTYWRKFTESINIDLKLLPASHSLFPALWQIFKGSVNS